MSVDVEGLDLDVLQSNDWNKYRPKVILIEILDKYLDAIDNNDIFIFLKNKSYRLNAKAVTTVIFVDSERVLTNA